MGQALSDQAYKLLKAEIIDCTLLPGEQIAQPQLATRFGFGITPIREALKQLVLEGYVRAVPRMGYIVQPISLRDVQDQFELRSILEMAAARNAAKCGTGEQFHALLDKCNFEYVFGDRQSYLDFLDRNADFHRSVAEIAGNRRLVQVLSNLLEDQKRLYHLELDLRDSALEMHEEHRSLALALHDRDPVRAERIVQAQVAISQERVMEAIRRAGQSGMVTIDGMSVQVEVAFN